MKIPDNITIGGQIIDVKLIDYLDNGYLGQISLGESEIVIAQNFNGRKQHQESIISMDAGCLYITCGSAVSGDSGLCKGKRGKTRSRV